MSAATINAALATQAALARSDQDGELGMADRAQFDVRLHYALLKRSLAQYRTGSNLILDCYVWEIGY
jgi:hypothetical protein